MTAASLSIFLSRLSGLELLICRLMYVLWSQNKELQVFQQVTLKVSHKDTKSDLLEGKGLGPKTCAASGDIRFIGDSKQPQGLSVGWWMVCVCPRDILLLSRP